MLKITFNKQAIELPNDFEITIVEHGNVFTFDTLQGGYSIPVSVPLSVKNQQIFGFPFRPEKNSNAPIEGDAEVTFNGIPIARGLMKAEEVSQKSIEFTIFVNNGAFYHQIKDKILTELDYGDDCTFILPTFAENGLLYPQRYVLAPVDNVDFYTDTILEEYKTFDSEYYKSALERQNPFLNVDFSGVEFYFDENVPVPITPFPFAEEILKYVLMNFTYKFDNQVTDTAFSTYFPKQLIFNVNNILLEGTKTYSGETITYYYFNSYNHVRHLPETLVTEFLLSIQNFWNVFINVHNGRAVMISRTDMLLSEEYIEFSDRLMNITTKKISGQSSGWQISIQRDEADSYQSDIIDFSTSENSYIEQPRYDSDVPFELISAQEPCNTIAFFKWTAQMQKEKDLAFQPQPFPKKYYIASEGSYGWQVLPEDMQSNVARRNVAITNDMFSTGKAIKIPLYSSSLNDNNVGAANWYVRTLPKVNQGGNIRILDRKEPFSLRYLFHFSNDSQAWPYSNVPYAGSGYIYGVPPSGYGPTEEKDAFSYSAQWSYYERWKTFLEWFQTVDAEYTIYLALTAADIFNFDFTKKYRINESTYFIKDIEYTLSNNGISIVKATAIRV